MKKPEENDQDRSMSTHAGAKEWARWKCAARRSFVPAIGAAAATTIVASLCGHLENGDAVAPINDISHIVWGDAAFEAQGISARHTLLGLILNASAAWSWTMIFERFCGDAAREESFDDAIFTRRAARVAGGGALVSAIAYLVDYHVVPPRLAPGFERHLSRRALLLVYAALALSLAAGEEIYRARALRADEK